MRAEQSSQICTSYSEHSFKLGILNVDFELLSVECAIRVCGIRGVYVSIQHRPSE